MAHAFGGNWIKTMNTGGYMSAGNDPAKVTWFEDEMQALGQLRIEYPKFAPLWTFASCEISIRLRSRARSPPTLRLGAASPGELLYDLGSPGRSTRGLRF